MTNSFIKRKPEFDQPQWNATLWRYMSFDKFFDLIFSESLFLTNINKMTDKNEAVIPKKNIRPLKQGFINNTIDKNIGEKAFQTFLDDLHRRKNSCFVNCWIMDPNENYALWKIYLGGSKQGIAIKTKTKSLLDSISNVAQDFGEDLYFSKVDYTDYIKGDINIENLITSKRNPYKYESEARLIVMKDPEFHGVVDGEQEIQDGLKLKVNPDTLIEQIYISPFGGKIFDRTIRQLLKKTKPNLESRVRNSQIKDS